MLLLILAMPDSYFLKEIIAFFSFFKKTNFDYLSYLTAYPFYAPASVTLLFSGFLFAFLATEKRLKIKMMYQFLTVIFSLVFFYFHCKQICGAKIYIPYRTDMRDARYIFSIFVFKGFR